MHCASNIVARLLMLVVATCVTGCPRFAYVSVFNNSGVDVRILVAGEDHGLLRKGMTTRFRFTGQTFELFHGSVRWRYVRQIPHGGENGPYFDGKLRVQLESDGRLYALKAEQNLPVLRFEDQPAGFPLKPTDSEFKTEVHQPPNKSVQPTPGSVTPRASEGTSK